MGCASSKPEIPLGPAEVVKPQPSPVQPSPAQAIPAQAGTITYSSTPPTRASTPPTYARPSPFDGPSMPKPPAPAAPSPAGKPPPSPAGMSPAASGGMTPRMSETVWMAPAMSSLSSWLSPASSGTTSLDRWGSRQSGEVLAPSLPLRCALVSKVGTYPNKPDRENEDSGACMDLTGHPGVWVFGVFDGHGPQGAECSRLALEKVTQRLPVQLHKTHSDVGKALTQALIEADSSLHRHKTRTTLSGTTALMGVVSGATLTVAHVGDSRAVLATRAAPGAAPTARQLTVDHTPRVPEEHERVTRAGAVILTVDQLEGIKDKSLQCWGPEFDGDGDPPRVWAPNADWPGTAFTRSLGDRVAKRLGVICVPEITTVDINPATTPFLIMASDGIWEFISPQAAVDLVAQYTDPLEAAEKLVEQAYNTWLANEPRSDDITVIIVAFDDAA
ncbi:hypothetical protein ACKKBG_A12830 [Auxenochlorella protothecoides x Auxenochlorella symbiontica]